MIHKKLLKMNNLVKLHKIASGVVVYLTIDSYWRALNAEIVKANAAKNLKESAEILENLKNSNMKVSGQGDKFKISIEYLKSVIRRFKS